MSAPQVGAPASRDGDTTSLADVRAEIAKRVTGGPLVMSPNEPVNPTPGLVWIRTI